MPKTFLSTLVFAAGAALFALAGAAQATPLLIGTPNAGSGNSFPFTSSAGSRYQQVYAASSFSGTVTIGSITFFNNELPGAIFQTGDYAFTFSTSNFTVNNLDTANLNNNPGADAALFASLNLSGATGAQFTVTAGTGGGAAFVYDPSAGDLLVDIVRSNPAGAGSGFLDAMNEGTAGGLFSRAHDFGTGFQNWGLVTEFDITTASVSVPEPAALALFGFGLAGLGYARRRKTA